MVDRGNGAAELYSENTVSDGFWHSVVVNFSPTLMEIVLDGKMSSVQLIPTGNRYLDLDLGETLFVGKKNETLHLFVSKTSISYNADKRFFFLKRRKK